jgi:hypothetical protein
MRLPSGGRLRANGALAWLPGRAGQREARIHVCAARMAAVRALTGPMVVATLTRYDALR